VDRASALELRGLGDRIDRQICILSWFYERYSRVLPAAAIVRYEGLIDSRGRALVTLVREADRLDVELRSKNRNELYGHQMMLRLADRLLSAEGAFWEFYSRESVEALAEDEPRGGGS
jgi:hypothetical protein